MNVNQKIIQALDVLAPIEAGVYTGDADTYFTFNYTTMGDAFSDDEPGCERYLVQAHLFCPLQANSLEMRAGTKARLAAAGFTWPSETPAEDKSGQHYVFECETAEAVSDGPA